MPRTRLPKLVSRPERDSSDLTGREYGRLRVEGRTKGGWLCSCSCGGSVVLDRYTLRRDRDCCDACRDPSPPRTVWQTPTRVKGVKTPEYLAWLRLRATVRQRRDARNDAAEALANDFDLFVKGLSPRPRGTGWTLRKVHRRLAWSWLRTARAKRRLPRANTVEHGGKQWTRAALARHLGVSPGTLRRGLLRGETADEIAKRRRALKAKPITVAETPDDEDRVEY